MWSGFAICRDGKIFDEIHLQVTAEVESKFCLPNPSMKPRDVITTVLDALMANDVPYPDHGCAVAIRFSSESNPGVTRIAMMMCVCELECCVQQNKNLTHCALAVSEMESTRLGNFLRSTDLRVMLCC